jgi:predicted transglutaminase-like cysteine proteinase
MLWTGTAAQAAILATNTGNEDSSLDCGLESTLQSRVLPSAPSIHVSKSAAILGGQPSALERIRLSQEAHEAMPGTLGSPLMIADGSPVQALSPALGGARLAASECPGQIRASQASALGSGDFLASKRLAVGRTSFDRDWQRVSDDRISARRFRRLVGASSGAELGTLQLVNSWVNQAIAFTADRELFERADYWAGAATTLKLRRGDCEDIALTKLQLLAAAGIPRQDMVLTIARDLVRNADHAVLIVRHDGRYYMLDNASDEILDASLGHDYRPILSFGSDQTWLHGY